MEAFIRSLKRFAVRREMPAKMVSDNGKTFKAVAKLIHSIVSHDDVQQHLAGLGVQWIFNLPRLHSVEDFSRGSSGPLSSAFARSLVKQDSPMMNCRLPS